MSTSKNIIYIFWDFIENDDGTFSSSHFLVSSVLNRLYCSKCGIYNTTLSEILQEFLIANSIFLGTNEVKIVLMRKSDILYTLAIKNILGHPQWKHIPCIQFEDFVKNLNNERKKTGKCNICFNEINNTYFNYIKSPILCNEILDKLLNDLKSRKLQIKLNFK